MAIQLVKDIKNKKPCAPPADREILLALRVDSLEIARSKFRVLRRVRDPNDASTENKLAVLAYWVEGLQHPIPPLPAPAPSKHPPTVLVV
jgi:hypothetical protein